MIVKRITFGVIALVWAIIAILAEQRLEESHSVKSTLDTVASIFVYVGCSLIAME